MYILGHCLISDHCGLLAPDEVFGRALIPLMLPDYARSHDWMYGFDETRGGWDASVIRSHLLADWHVHFGPQASAEKKMGWAYQRMGAFTCLYKWFFSTAADRGLLEPETAPPDSLRGFSHTMVEYTIDTFVARAGGGRSFQRNKGYLRRSWGGNRVRLV